MDLAFWTERRVAGGVLASGLLLLLIALVVMFASGAAAHFGEMISGPLAQRAPYVDTFRPLILMFAVGWLVQLVGLGLLARLLARGGAGQLAVLALAVVSFASLVGFMYSTFRMDVEMWVAQEAARSGAVPAFYEPISNWIHDSFRVAYRAHFIAMVGFGMAILRSGLLSSSMGWATIGWSGLWFVSALLGSGAPALPFFMPAAIGVALLAQPPAATGGADPIRTAQQVSDV